LTYLALFKLKLIDLLITCLNLLPKESLSVSKTLVRIDGLTSVLISL